jgi:hypothetical protein
MNLSTCYSYDNVSILNCKSNQRENIKNEGVGKLRQENYDFPSKFK